jgi:hypothetical protein
VTDLERRRALALGRCTFPPATSVKRFARDMARIAEHKPAQELTENQARWLETLCWRYRRQLQENGHGNLVPEAKPERW